jgi:hypothetical protein
VRDQAPPPAPATLFRLTDRGRELRDTMHALGRWGAPLLADDFGDDAFRTHWLALPLEIGLGERVDEVPPATIGIRAGREDLVVELRDGTVHTRAWANDDAPDVTLTGPPKLILGVLVGKLELEDARARRVKFEGDVGKLERILAAPQA